MTLRLCRPIHTPPHDPALGDSAVQHFYDKLIHIQERLKTEPGKLMGQKRHKLVGIRRLSLSPLVLKPHLALGLPCLY